ncbi:hypothetical protein PROPHIGD79-1_105 [Mycobacterium phage prophi79-1]|uniref:DUF1360 domain-containing protein n=1 Tax=Mycobacteroides abscessus TaxID=36809 RepID=UPI0019D24896|nr:DUF1360 domain-containing protein [Mycobacteroides abscessus]MBN7317911.1 DUF1360 domain-containing protein [Mycobacteroides abscessus subsp. massiliense]QSM01892.1 hypothetical protein PROPHIGD79-1_105 [Mycobacterium phage prophi79-1]
MNIGLVFAIYVFAVMRLTRLINADTILDAPRIAVARKARDGERSAAERRRWAVFSDFLECPWCVGMWLSLAGAVAAVLVLGWPWWAVLPVGLACSQIVGMAAPWFQDDEIEYQTVES